MNQIQVFNTLTRTKEILKGKNPNILNIYTCGPTVYDSSHIGHARASVTWDFVVRFLRHLGLKVTWTRNITDIDDKIINKANEQQIHPDKIARIFTHSYHDDMLALNVMWPDFEPRATQYIHEMINFIEGLIKNGFAYKIDSDVYFLIEKFKTYGKLKGQTISELEKGYGRIEANPKKKHPLDFALWKGVKTRDEYGFNSPFGRGRPGWHLECSVMNLVIYGQELDIHCGGDDLIFPHHDNEIAQSESYSNSIFAKYWLHNGMILVNGKKMAKSEGNYVTIKEALKKYSGNALRLFILNTHYRMPINYTDEAIMAAQNGINRIYEALNNCPDTTYEEIKSNDFIDEFNDSLADDFNSPKALAILFKLVESANKETNSKLKLNFQKTLLKLSDILGFNLNQNYESKAPLVLNTAVSELLTWRNQCKINKDFITSDKIREILNKSKIEIKDLATNISKWQIKWQ